MNLTALSGVQVPIPVNYIFTSDNIVENTQDHVLPPNVLGFKDLGVQAKKVTEGFPIEHLRHYRVGGYDFGERCLCLAVIWVHSLPGFFFKQAYERGGLHHGLLRTFILEVSQPLDDGGIRAGCRARMGLAIDSYATAVASTMSPGISSCWPHSYWVSKSTEPFMQAQLRKQLALVVLAMEEQDLWALGEYTYRRYGRITVYQTIDFANSVALLLDARSVDGMAGVSVIPQF